MPASVHRRRCGVRLVLLLAGLYVFSSTSSSAVPAQHVPRIPWLPCDPTLAIENDHEFDGRLSCARFRAPLDHEQPDGRTIEVGAVRMAAADRARRKGVLFVNIGGPGGHPGRLVTELVSAFQSWDRDDPVHGAERELVDRYDIIGVIPRGLPGGWTLDCGDALNAIHPFPPTHRDDTHWGRLVAAARTLASACTTSPEARYVGTEQHVHDMDFVRRAIGEDRIDFYGVSYGGRVGAWYAAMYPDHIGNMLLDSSMVFPASFRTATYASMDARQKQFEKQVLAPLLANPRRFGQPIDRAALRWAPHALHPAVRPYWYDMLDTPDHLAAALTMSRWLDEDGWRGWRHLAARMTTSRMSEDTAAHDELQAAAWELLAPQLAPAVSASPPSPEDRLVQSTYLAVVCNDESNWESEAQIRARADNDAFRYPLDNGVNTFVQLVCASWGPRTSRAPDLDVLAQGQPFLMLHAANDVATPIAGARNIILPTFPNARLITVTGTDTHGLLGQSGASCIEHDAARYLLDGTLPVQVQRESVCPFQRPDQHPAYYQSR
jgi:pimeloyl-ACP methyl ester carboxylesterase